MGAHLSLGTVTAYFDVTTDGEVRGLNPIGSARFCDETLRALGAAALWALGALEELREDRPHVPDLESVGNAAERVAGLPSQL